MPHAGFLAAVVLALTCAPSAAAAQPPTQPLQLRAVPASQTSCAGVSSWAARLERLRAAAQSEFREVLAARCGTVPLGRTLLVGTHVGWMGHDNIGDDIMPPLFAATLSAALAEEYPGLEVSSTWVACPRKGANPRFIAAKHFWALGGGSVLEYLGARANLRDVARQSVFRGEPLYLFGPGFQATGSLSTPKLSSHLGIALRPGFRRSGAASEAEDDVSGGSGDGGRAATASPVTGRGVGGSGGSTRMEATGLLWGGTRGPLSRDIVDSITGAPGALRILGDPGFMTADLLLSPQHAAAGATPAIPPGQYIVTTCDTTTMPELPATLEALAADGYHIVVLSIGRFSWRTKNMERTFERVRDRLGAERVTTLSLHNLASDLPALIGVLRGAALGIHCMLHGGIIQAGAGGAGAVLAPFSEFKHLDAWLPTGQTGSLVHGMGGGKTTMSVLLGKARRLLAVASPVTAAALARTAAFAATVRMRHVSSMRAFVRYLTRTRFPAVGSALACAPNGTRVTVRAHSLWEGAVVEVEVPL